VNWRGLHWAARIAVAIALFDAAISLAEMATFPVVYHIIVGSLAEVIFWAN